MASDRFLILHGWGGNKPTHWQEILAGELEDMDQSVIYPKMPDPAEPDLPAWLAAAEAALEQAAGGGRLTVLAHSLGSITWMHLVAKRGPSARQIADRVLLVAPPYMLPDAPPPDVPATVPAFFPPPFAPDAIKAASGRTVIVASDTDDYATYEQSAGYATQLGIPIHLLKGAGHISPYYGYGEWPWVLDWCLRRAQLPPVPRPA